MSDFREDVVTVLDALSRACVHRSQTLMGSLPDEDAHEIVLNKARALFLADIGLIAEKMIEIIDQE